MTPFTEAVSNEGLRETLATEALNMQSRWTYVATGVMTGIIGVLSTIVIMQNREPQAYAAPASVDDCPRSIDLFIRGAKL